jgi:hypothetical protein
MAEWFPRGFYNNMAMQLTGLNDKLAQLNSNLTAASASTERLSLALNWLTGLGAVVGFLGVIVAAVEVLHRWNMRS